MSYEFLQHYWWFLVSLLGALLVFLLFVQGANTLIFNLGKNEIERRLVVNSTGRKWEFTFTTLVVFGGGFFASFPLFYSTSFGGAYWIWMLILFSFIIQAVSYEFQNKIGNILGAKTFQYFLIINGVVAPLLIGGAVATFFNGSNFIIDKGNITDTFQPIISRWANESHGLDALLDVWNLVLGIAIFCLARVLGCLYIVNNVAHDAIRARARKHLLINAVVFLIFFLAFLIRTLLKDGFAVDPTDGHIYMEPYKYLNNFIEMWYLLVLLLVGVVATLYGIGVGVFCKNNTKGIWFSGVGVVLVVLSILLNVGWNNTAYYPSNVDLQSSLTIFNSSGSRFTLTAMSVVSLFIPFVFAYIIYAWWTIDKKKIEEKELMEDSHAY